MSKIHELIAELCPEGVPVLAFGDLVINRDNERSPVTRDLRLSGAYPYYGANGIQDHVEEFIFDGTFLLIGEDGSVIEADGAPVLNWAEGKIWVNNHAHVLQEKPDGPNLRYLYFYLSTINVSGFVTGGSQKKINQGNLNKIPIPLPPIEVQREIVSILDKFKQLEAELEAELEARRSQYEHKRDQLLDFSGDLSSHPLRELIAEFCPEGVKSLSIAEIAEVGTGSSDKKDTAISGLFPLYVRSKNVEKSDTFEFDETAIIIPGEGGVGDIFHFATGKYALHQRAYRISPVDSRVDPKYLFYAFKVLFKDHISSKAVSATVTSIRKPMVTSFSVPIPPLEVQREIVSILDKLDALVNDLTFGLPAEIAARRKQYEYYRNKLLTFKELETA